MIAVGQFVFVIVAGLYVVGLLSFLVGLYLSRPTQKAQRKAVSVIVAARDEEENIGILLTDLCRQTYPRDLYEIIVVNDGSSDRTETIVEDFQSKYDNVQLLHARNAPGSMSPKKYALEMGVHAARGEIILTTDADCRVASSWIESLLSYFEDDVGMVVGFSQIGRKGQKRSLLESLQAVDFLSLMGAAAGACQIGFPLAGSGQNLGYRKVAFEAVGGYSQVGHRVSGDDVLLLQLIRSQTPWKIRFAFDARSFVTTKPEKPFVDLLNQRRRWASNGAYQLVLNKPFFAFALNTFLLNLFTLVGVPLALAFGGMGFVLTIFLTKALAELSLALRASQIFGRADLLRYFPLWLFLEVPYVVIAGIGGSFGNFAWKGRSHKAAISPGKL